jgi:uncharacterized protein
VNKEIAKIAKMYDQDVLFVASYAHMRKDEGQNEWKYVDSEAEEVDLYILNMAQRGDIVVTQDTGLASMLIGKGVYVLSPRGKYYNKEDMDQILFFRYASAKERRAGRYPKGGPSAFSENDRQNFKESFIKLLSNLKGI